MTPILLKTNTISVAKIYGGRGQRDMLGDYEAFIVSHAAEERVLMHSKPWQAS